MERYSIRDALADEEDALSFVCLKTGDSGDDGTHLYTDDPGCLARIYTTPYLRQSPECAFVLCDSELEAEGLDGYPWGLAHPERGVVGYCLGTPDSTAFYAQYIAEALPPLRAAYPRATTPVESWTPSQHIHNEYHSDICFPEELGGSATAPFVPAWVTDCFPAHLHIDILSHVQRGGWGTKMITAQLQRLTELGAIGVHLIQSPSNYRAYKFYKTLGFVEIGRGEGDLILGRQLVPPNPLWPAPGTPRPRCFGVVEGFYGRPWSAEQRSEMVGKMGGAPPASQSLSPGAEFSGLDTYMYSPKDDRKHRAAWRELYTAAELSELGALESACSAAGVRMVYGLGPGLDLDPGDAEDSAAMVAKLRQLVDVGVRSFMIAFDDVEETEPGEPYVSAAEAQGAVANRCCIALWEATFGAAADGPAPMFLFCPTEYCGRIAQPEDGQPWPDAHSSAYLRDLGRELLPIIDLCWTGDEIISPTISAADIRAVSEACAGRRVVVWDNLHANDYDQGRRIYLGPYDGRDPAMLEDDTLAGIITNPNCPYECNFVPLATLSLFVADPHSYAPGDAARAAVESWASRFGAPMTVDDVQLLVDLFYLPYAHGPRAEALLQNLDSLHAEAHSGDSAAFESLSRDFGGVAAAVGGLFERLTEITQRELCYAIYPYMWDVKEELDMLERYVGWLGREGGSGAEIYADDELPTTIYPKFEQIYRGGILAELQRRVPLARDVREAVRPGAAAHFRRPAARL